MAISALAGLGKLTELRQRILFVLGAMVVFRLGTHIPVPGVDPVAVAALFEQTRGSIVDVFNMFSGGALTRLSIFALGVMPYISASIIMQMMSAVIPQLEQLKKEGEAGRRKITQYTRYGTVVLATFQALGIAIAIEGQMAGGGPVVLIPGLGFKITTVASLVTGTMFLVWLGEQISERGIGNGISLIIFGSIVAGLPAAVAGTLELARTGSFTPLGVLALFVGAIVITGVVVFIERGQRRITVNYAKRQQGRRMMAGQTSHLPLKLNMAGVIPPIFASSLMALPLTAASFSGGTSDWIVTINALLGRGQPLYLLILIFLIVFFAFFYTAIVFNPEETAENLRKNGGYVPGIRPGESTANYLDFILTRLTVLGSAYLAAVCILPEILISQYSVPFYFGGTSLLIVVSVTLDTVSQVQSHLIAHQYEGLIKKSRLRGRTR